MLRCYRENTLRTDVPYLLIRKMSLTRGTIHRDPADDPGGRTGRGMGGSTRGRSKGRSRTGRDEPADQTGPVWRYDGHKGCRVCRNDRGAVPKLVSASKDGVL